ncbi:DUF1853 family protein [Paraferrimonas sp. SM1919]|uniref:DUF1853 family protein n=1 Tax=Paraferrimonas sp. SM1919 TaxID=2662263 RepID=UPI0021105FED|nr:DUF1853 family protein [Paraferrimonas sp. SM1919]
MCPWLHWLCSSPELMAFPEPFHFPRSQANTMHVGLNNVPRFQPSNKRLGFVFEDLLLHFFSYHPDYQLLAHNLQIHHQGKTLGAFDFIVHYLPNNEVQHIEATIKYYLAKPSNTSDNGWCFLGPNKNDSLDKKWQHMHTKQLRLRETETAKEVLLKQGICIDHAYGFSRGAIYWPKGSTAEFEPMLQQGHKQGIWLHQQQLHQQQLNLVEKHYWPLPQLAPQQPYMATEKAQMAFDAQSQHEVFITPDGW